MLLCSKSILLGASILYIFYSFVYYGLLVTVSPRTQLVSNSISFTRYRAIAYHVAIQRPNSGSLTQRMSSHLPYCFLLPFQPVGNCTLRTLNDVVSEVITGYMAHLTYIDFFIIKQDSLYVDSYGTEDFI